MDDNSINSVKQFIQDINALPNDFSRILKDVQALFLAANPNLLESIKYGGLVFSCQSELIAGIFVYKNHISIEFSQGASLDDPDSILQGKGTFRRHIKLKDHEDIKTYKVAQFIELTCKTGC